MSASDAPLTPPLPTGERPGGAAAGAEPTGGLPDAGAAPFALILAPSAFALPSPSRLALPAPRVARATLRALACDAAGTGSHQSVERSGQLRGALGQTGLCTSDWRACRCMKFLVHVASAARPWGIWRSTGAARPHTREAGGDSSKAGGAEGGACLPVAVARRLVSLHDWGNALLAARLLLGGVALLLSVGRLPADGASETSWREGRGGQGRGVRAHHPSSAQVAGDAPADHLHQARAEAVAPLRRAVAGTRPPAGGADREVICSAVTRSQHKVYIQ